MRKNEFLVFSLVALIISAFCFYRFFSDAAKNTLGSNPHDYSNEAFTPVWITVDIKGEVIRPTIYQVPKEWMLVDLLELAGVLPTADLSSVNQATVLAHGSSYYIPKYGGQADGSKQKISLNAASKEELMTLPGIGEVIAQRIIDYRAAQYFTSINDVKNVSGIGDVVFDKIKDFITI